MTPNDDASFNNTHSFQVLDKTHLTPTHPSSKVNVVQVTSTANTSQEMWDRMKQDTNEPERQEEEEQQQAIVVKTSMFEFRFEFGSKRPPRATAEDYYSEKEEDEILDIEKEDDLSENQEGRLSEDHIADYEDSILSEDSYSKKEFIETIDTEQLPSATADAMETYENIVENIYIGSATGRSMAEESMPCECKYDPDFDDPSEACGDDSACINRMMFMECIAQDCPCGRLCRNRRFQLGQYARVDVIRTEKKGYGLRALTDLPNNSFIMEYIGEVITQNEFLHRTRKYDIQGFKHYYFMTLKSDEVIDATKKGCLARFMNHSCRPNCVTQKWVIGKKMRIGIFTSRSIKAGEELTFDYKFERYGAVAQRCFCGEASCKGFIGATNEHVEEEILTDTDSSSEDDEEVDIETAQPLQDTDKVQTFVKKMLNSVGNDKLVNKLLMRLKLTNPNNSHGRDILKMIIRLHGLRMLKFWLGEWKHNETIVYKTMEVLDQLPLKHRNGLEDCKLLEAVERFTQHENTDICQLATHLTYKWNQLKCVYRIPKRHHVEIEDSPASSPDDAISMDTSSVTDASVTMDISPILEAMDTMDEMDGIDELDTENAMDISLSDAESITPIKTSKKNQHLRKKSKVESSRDFFDPDDDYYEYIPLTITAEELIKTMYYPLLPSHIPTGSIKDNTTPKNPTGIIETNATAKKPIGAIETNAIKNNATVKNPIGTIKNNTVKNPAGPIKNNTTVKDQHDMYDYYNYYYYYYYNYYCPTQEQTPLPANWQLVMNEDGSGYYYNTLTQKSQWEVPREEEQKHPTPSDSPPLPLLPPPPILSPPPPPPPPPPVLSSSPLSHLTAGKLATPTASITEEEGLSEIELKVKIGKVVTKYLSLTNQLSLWKGDKDLFKEMARKMTHYIVDKEVKSGRKIKELDGNFRVKIEKFIDTFKQL